MGTTVGAFPLDMQMAAWGREFLGWNLKWVPGYRGTGELFMALRRGEIDMTATGNVAPIAKLLATGTFKILVQAGSGKDGRHVARAEFGDAPLMPVMIAGRIKDPIAAKGFDYWMTISSGPEKWLALPPRTSEACGALSGGLFALVSGRILSTAAEDGGRFPGLRTSMWIKIGVARGQLDFSTMIQGGGLSWTMTDGARPARKNETRMEAFVGATRIPENSGTGTMPRSRRGRRRPAGRVMDAGRGSAGRCWNDCA
jgi:hypothetical protein